VRRRRKKKKENLVGNEVENGVTKRRQSVWGQRKKEKRKLGVKSGEKKDSRGTVASFLRGDAVKAKRGG